MTSLTEFDPASLKKEETQQFIHQRRQFGSPHKLVQLVDKAVMNFVAVGEDIAAENPEFRVRDSTLQPHPLLLQHPLA